MATGTGGDGVTIDHVTIAGAELAQLERAFERLGIDPDYGGSHDGLPTHMSIVGFEDRSYIELIAKETSGTAPYWNDAMDANAGPCAWAARSDTIDANVESLRATGIPVEGPDPYSRDRPDGSTARWRLAFLGDGEPGSLLPFLIEDETPLERRAEPTPSATDAGLVGIDSVVVAVSDIEAAVATVETAFGESPPERSVVTTGPFAGTVASFSTVPVHLVEPSASDPLTERLRTVGEGPCGFVLETADIEAIRNRVGSIQRTQLGLETVSVIDPEAIDGLASLCLTER